MSSKLWRPSVCQHGVINWKTTTCGVILFSYSLIGKDNVVLECANSRQLLETLGFVWP